MKVHWLDTPDLGSSVVEQKLREQLKGALESIATKDGAFWVNDSAWYQQTSQGKIKPCVVNSAKFITTNFQNYLLSEYDWETEMTIRDQTFDAYKIFEAEFTLFSMKAESFLGFLAAYEEEKAMPSGPIATSVYQDFVVRGQAMVAEEFAFAERFFKPKTTTTKIRIGLEFETGNIASSFRALNKLEKLYRHQEIDLGVFVTSINKRDCSARIWPQTNRNGSFEELDKRGFAEDVGMPLWKVAFEPDGFDQAGPYLGDDATTYELSATTETLVDGATEYEVWIAGAGRRVLRKIGG